MENNKETFRYTYSAGEQEEIRNIRRKYAAPEENKMEQLRRLDRSASNRATAAAITVGVIGALLLGLGMSCTMVWQGMWFIPGILVGVVGIAVICFAYPLYTRILEKERKRIAPEILRLADELMK